MSKNRVWPIRAEDPPRQPPDNATSGAGSGTWTCVSAGGACRGSHCTAHRRTSSSAGSDIRSIVGIHSISPGEFNALVNIMLGSDFPNAFEMDIRVQYRALGRVACHWEQQDDHDNWRMNKELSQLMSPVYAI
ncbi:MAG: hypothetical protein ACE5GZ_09285 [Gammaproteobacteria bacterium]